MSRGCAARRSIPRLSLVLLLLGALVGCGAGIDTRAGHAPAVSPPGDATLVRSELVFGRARPDGSTVSDAQWRAFLDTHVTPRFPDGLTVIDASGQYRTRAGRLVRESSKVLVLLHEDAEKSRAAIREIRTLYRQLFDQESVLLITSSARVSF